MLTNPSQLEKCSAWCVMWTWENYKIYLVSDLYKYRFNLHLKSADLHSTRFDALNEHFQSRLTGFPWQYLTVFQPVALEDERMPSEELPAPNARFLLGTTGASDGYWQAPTRFSQNAGAMNPSKFHIFWDKAYFATAVGALRLSIMVNYYIIYWGSVS